MKTFILSLLVLGSVAQAEWSNISATAYSQRGEDPGPAAIAACNVRVRNYIQACKQAGKTPVVFSGGCMITGYSANAAFASVAVQCN